MASFKTRLLILTFTTVQCFANRAAALPTVIETAQHTDRFRPFLDNPTLPAGDYLLIYAQIETTDSPGSPTITVSAKQGDTMLTLERRTQVPNEYHGFVDFDSSLTGAWEINVTDSTGTGLTAFTNALAEPEFLPFVDSISAQGSPLGGSLTWTLPDLTGFDVDSVHVRIIQVTPRSGVFSSNLLPAHTTSFNPPPGLLQYGVEYAYNVALIDHSGFYIENRSVAQSEPFRYALPGDFNLDGTIDAADYVIWRDQSGQQSGYNTWRGNFGEAIGSGSVADRAVPEPATLALLAVGVVVMLALRRRSG